MPRKGENNGRAKLTVEKVKEIRRYWLLYGGRGDPKPGKHNNRITSANKLAREYRVGQTTMRLLLNGKTWQGVKPGDI